MFRVHDAVLVSIKTPFHVKNAADYLRTCLDACNISSSLFCIGNFRFGQWQCTQIFCGQAIGAASFLVHRPRHRPPSSSKLTVRRQCLLPSQSSEVLCGLCVRACVPARSACPVQCRTIICTVVGRPSIRIHAQGPRSLKLSVDLVCGCTSTLCRHGRWLVQMVSPTRLGLEHTRNCLHARRLEAVCSRKILGRRRRS